MKTLISAKIMVDDLDWYGRTALMESIVNGHESIVKLLLNEGVDFEDQLNNSTPLQVAAEKGFCLIARQLLNKGARVDAATKYRDDMPLMIAVAWNHADMTSVLIDKGANLNKRYSSGETLLIKAAESGFKEVVISLLDNHADITAKVPDGQGALECAVSKRKETRA